MNQTLSWIYKTFDKQTEEDYRNIIHKMLFTECVKLNISDWRVIRTKEYWDGLEYIHFFKEDCKNLSIKECKKIKELKKAQYIFRCINEYLKNKE